MSHLKYLQSDELGRLDMSIDTDTVPGCWVWEGCRVKRGAAMHPVIYCNSKMFYADRLAYSREYGDMGAGTRLIQTCKTEGCINPKHREIYSNSTNVFSNYQIDSIESMLAKKLPVYKIMQGLGISSVSSFYKRLDNSGYVIDVCKHLRKKDDTSH